MSIAYRAIRHIFACSAILLLGAVEAPAAVRFVATTGNDSSVQCTRTAPCLTLQRGIDVADAGDEVQFLDSGVFGPKVTINKSITISGEGGEDVALTSGAAISVNAPGAKVVLRGLHLDGSGDTGILIADAASVHIEDCAIQRFNRGIFLDDADTKLSLSNSVLSENLLNGLLVGGAGAARVTIDSSRFENNGQQGLTISGVIIVATVTDSVFSGHANSGINQNGGKVTVIRTVSANNGNGILVGYGGTPGQMTLESFAARGNGIGVGMNTGSTVRLSNSVVTNNTVGVEVRGTLLTQQNNTISGNGTDISVIGGTVAPLPEA